MERGEIVRELALALRARRDEAAAIVAEETGKALELALGEADAAVEMGFFVAGEGRRLYGRTTTSAMPNRTVLVTRRPVGVAGLIVSFNTPLPNYAWKVFPAVFCGNSAVLKPSEHTPASAAFFGELCQEPSSARRAERRPRARPGGRPAARRVARRGPRQLHGLGRDRPDGLRNGRARGSRRSVLELGGKNALVVCDDADLDRAVEWSLASAFSNAGQRCAAASRIVVFDSVYDEFRERFLAGARSYETGPVISEESLERILALARRRERRWRAASGSTGRAGGSHRPSSKTSLPDAPALAHGALRPGRDPLSRARPRGGDRARERLAVRAHLGDPHREPASRDALRGRGRGRRGRRQRRHARQRAAHGLRRREAVRARAGGKRASRRSTSTRSGSTST